MRQTIEIEAETITSKRRCPVCKHRKWYILDPNLDGDRSGVVGCWAVIDDNPTQPCALQLHDECANCGTIVTG